MSNNGSLLALGIVKKKIRTIISLCLRCISLSIVFMTAIYIFQNIGRPDDQYFGVSFWYKLGTVVLLAGVISLTVLLFHTFVLRSRGMKKIPYWLFLLLQFLFFITAVFLSTLAVCVFVGGNMLENINIFHVLIFSAILSFITLVVEIFSRFWSKDFIRSYILGKYHTPKKEEKIFAFIDLTSSTQIGEMLDYGQFFELINDFFALVDQSAEFYNGTIHKYIEDGVLLVWDGADEDSYRKVVQCIASLEEEIHFKQDYFKKKYGLTIRYTAGIHVGTVYAGCIGEGHCEVAYFGDTMNITQRVQAACNFYSSRIIFSRTFVAACLEKYPEVDRYYTFENIGDVVLKGRTNPLGLMKPVSRLK